MPRLELGSSSLIIDSKKISPNKMDEISEALSDVKLKNSIFYKYPLEESETLEQWHERVTPLMKEEAAKRDDEDGGEYLKRVLYKQESKKQVLFDTLQALAKIFNQSDKVTMEAFNNTSYMDMKKFVVDVLKACDLPTVDFE